MVTYGVVIRTCKACGQRNRVGAEHLADGGRCGRCKAELAPSAEPIDVDEAEFGEIVSKARVPVLVDFWAAGCGPCRMAAPSVKRVAQSMAGKAIVLKVDTDKQPRLAARFKVQGIPNFAVLNNGELVLQQAGLVNHQQMEAWLRQAGSRS